jgi:hypothetical protein
MDLQCLTKLSLSLSLTLSHTLSRHNTEGLAENEFTINSAHGLLQFRVQDLGFRLRVQDLGVMLCTWTPTGRWSIIPIGIVTTGAPAYHTHTHTHTHHAHTHTLSLSLTHTHTNKHTHTHTHLIHECTHTFLHMAGVSRYVRVYHSTG